MLKNINSLDSLPCSQIKQYSPSKATELLISFKIKKDKFESKEKPCKYTNKEIILTCSKSNGH